MAVIVKDLFYERFDGSVKDKRTILRKAIDCRAGNVVCDSDLEGAGE